MTDSDELPEELVAVDETGREKYFDPRDYRVKRTDGIHSHKYKLIATDSDDWFFCNTVKKPDGKQVDIEKVLLNDNTAPDTTDNMSDTYALEDAVEAVYERSDEHGEPEDSFARIAALWSGYFDQQIDDTDVVNAMILLKVARNREGHYTDDNWTDIAGYAENGARLGGESDD